MIRRFNRFELKYVIRAEVRDALVETLRRQMSLDAHGDDAGWYRVTSLYYDSPDAACYRSKIEGIKYRRKVRARIYGDHLEDPRGPVHLEIKQRINRTVQKRRIVLPFDEAHALAEGGPAPDLEREDDRQVAREIEFLGRTLLLRPACVITYLRQAWVGGQYEPGLRITFDQELCARGPERLLGPGQPAHHFIPDEWAIMEVKANDTVPLWVTRLLAAHQCTLRRVSKYCAGLAMLRGLVRAHEGVRPWTSS